MKKKVVIGLLGSVLDSGYTKERWNKWRPTVSVCQHEDLLVDRFDLLMSSRLEKLSRVILKDMHSVSPETKAKRHYVEFRDPWDFQEVYGTLLDFARTYPFQPEKEEYLIHITTGTHVAQICLYLLTESHYLPGRLLQTSPPPKRGGSVNPGSYSVIDLDLSKYDQIASRFRKEHKEGVSFLKSGIETRNENFNRLIERIEQVAIASKAPILLMGPTGAGKSQLARNIYDLKKNRRQVEGPFVEVNCATLVGEGAMSALFGHTKGAFTGAAKDRDGLLRSADGGILFLDEIGELGLDEQAMLLRALEEKTFLPLGSDTEVRSDFQLIAGTNRDLSSSVSQGKFREDLLARINLWTFRLPSLKDRREDIEPNIEFELDQFSRLQNVNVTFNKEAREKFLEFSTSSRAAWKGNFRDLNAAMNRMCTLAPGGRITKQIVEEETGRLLESWTPAEDDDQALLAEVLGAEKANRLDLFEKVQLQGVLQVCKNSKNLSEAGRKLFAWSREKKKMANDADRLRKYLGKFGVNWDSIQ